ncbi:OmpW/AlkL family protein [Beggiatoa leptomitoformis]|uniref:Outer membrane beta-barrel protein n=1 Tax=Beggiatoa leptomitoformis TaxID=288004 RepID=A0A2N9YIH6_9GAMM|nr:OmpW family outer membrane protein [Beggiatoa leptomitoformis]ALG67433.1 outer membrane beta-barrel protein [Beggiatoa leptomitoformis]AUI70351.1 outer membrane beta-barrel protein [Beggiatoa leptomitoformis]
MNLKKQVLPLLIVSSLGIVSAPVFAIDQGDILVRGRIININPDSDSGDVYSSATGTNVPGTTVDVEDAWTLDIDFTYMMTKFVGVELLLDLSSQHDVSSKGETLNTLAPGNIIETRVLPPALILQYHLLPDGPIRPYAGFGFNYTYFFNEKATNSLDAGLGGVSDVSLDSSFGWVAQMGVDYDINDKIFLNADVKYMDIGTTAEFNSGALGHVTTDVDINPWVIGFGIGTKF